VTCGALLEQLPGAVQRDGLKSAAMAKDVAEADEPHLNRPELGHEAADKTRNLEAPRPRASAPSRRLEAIWWPDPPQKNWRSVEVHALKLPSCTGPSDAPAGSEPPALGATTAEGQPEGGAATGSRHLKLPP